MPSVCGTTATDDDDDDDDDDFVPKRNGLITCVRNVANLQTHKLFSFLIRYSLCERERIK